MFPCFPTQAHGSTDRQAQQSAAVSRVKYSALATVKRPIASDSVRVSHTRVRQSAPVFQRWCTDRRNSCAPMSADERLFLARGRAGQARCAVASPMKPGLLPSSHDRQKIRMLPVASEFLARMPGYPRMVHRLFLRHKERTPWARSWLRYESRCVPVSAFPVREGRFAASQKLREDYGKVTVKKRPALQSAAFQKCRYDVGKVSVKTRPRSRAQPPKSYSHLLVV